MKMFKYCWVWEKNRPTGHIHSKNKPMKKHEDICVFSFGVTIHKGQSNNRMVYNPQGLINVNKTSYRPSRGVVGSNVVAGLRPSHKKTLKVTHENYPTSVLKIKSVHNVNAFHPTQKPVDLMEYLIKTYTNENETVLDFTMGSGTTGIACKNLNRNFIGIELNEEYFDIAKKRINENSLKKDKDQN
jgi:site-specific DNA-methyltransferase (adenine-specific)